MPVKKIVVIGPESTGKSSLCRDLADHYQSQWLPEYAREYLLENGKNYKYEDLLKIAQGQLRTEDLLFDKNFVHLDEKPVFIDTDLYVIKVWSEFVFGKCDNKILSSIANREYHLYLLCNIDLPWVPDELREYPDLDSRKKLFHYYHDAMVNQHVPWKIINGTNEQRLELAIKEIDDWMRSF